MFAIGGVKKVFDRRKELSLIYDNSEDAVVLFEKRDGAYHTVSINQAFLDGMQITKKEVLNKPAHQFFSKSLVEEFRKYEAQARKSERTVHWEYEVLLPKKGLRTFSVALTPITDDKKREYFLATARDITREEGIERIKKDLVSIVSHELGTPLALINSKAHSLLTDTKENLTDAQYRKVIDIDRAGRNVRELLDFFVAISQLESGGDGDQADMVQVLDEVISQFETECKERSIKIVDQVCDTVCMVHAHEVFLKIALSNLISNAVKYSPNNSTIGIRIDEIKKGSMGYISMCESDMYRVAVTDRGVGIVGEEKEQVFSKMFRTKNARVSGVSGMGLGLYIVRQIVFVLGGDVWFEANKETGTTFYLMLPKACV